jgi:hypothetical protein
MRDHNGFELSKIFELPKEDTAFSIRKALFIMYRHFLGLVPKKYWPFFDKLFGIYTVRQIFQEKYCPELIQQVEKKCKTVFFRGIWQSELYFDLAKGKVKEIYSFQKDRLSTKTQKMLRIIEEKNAVSIHVRRGDYLHHNNLGGMCTIDYYKHAIEYISSHTCMPHFFIFSDDVEWVKETFIMENVTFVDHNRGKDSWQDLYLMSKCKHNIIANSTFSWWGAYLNSNERKIVIAPKYWFVRTSSDDIVNKQWIVINNG